MTNSGLSRRDMARRTGIPRSTLQAWMKRLSLQVPPAPPTPQVPHTAPAPPVAERKDVQQWTIRLSKGLIEHLKAVAYERRIPPSQLVEELVRKSLMDHHPSTPSSASTPDRTSSGNP